MYPWSYKFIFGPKAGLTPGVGLLVHQAEQVVLVAVVLTGRLLALNRCFRVRGKRSLTFALSLEYSVESIFVTMLVVLRQKVRALRFSQLLLRPYLFELDLFA